MGNDSWRLTPSIRCKWTVPKRETGLIQVHHNPEQKSTLEGNGPPCATQTKWTPTRRPSL